MAKITTEDFINRSQLTHKGKYSYEKSVYVSAKDKVIITCRIHGHFLQKPYDHVSGRGCRECKKITLSKLKRPSNNYIISKFINTHGNKYDYSLVEHKKANRKVDIICKEHGVFSQTPINHANGHGCPKCGTNRMALGQSLDTNKFISKAIKVHGNKYDYSKCIYKTSVDVIEVVCKSHGIFEQLAGVHLRGHGCPKCAIYVRSKFNSTNPNGWSKNYWNESSKRSSNFDSFKVYIIRCWNDDEEFYKIGRTFRKTSVRFSTNTLMPYNYEILKEYIFNTAEEAFDYECELKKEHRSFKYTPLINFDGRRECFKQIKI